MLMTTGQGAGTKRTSPAAPPSRKPLWRRLNRHVWFTLHVFAFLILGVWIWTLNASTVDKQFDTLLLLTILCAHGMLLYRNSRIAFGFHLLMFSAGNGTIWTTTAPVSDKLSVTLGWAFVTLLSGLWLARRQFTARPAPVMADKAPRKPRTRKATQEAVQAIYEPPPETAWDDDAQSYTAEEWYEEPQAHSDADYYGDYAEPPQETSKRGKKRKT
jgi:hypothetical protein